MRRGGESGVCLEFGIRRKAQHGMAWHDMVVLFTTMGLGWHTLFFFFFVFFIFFAATTPRVG